MKRAQILERLIKSKGYNFRSYAEKCNIPYTSLYTILKRTSVNKASVKVIVKICKELGIKVEDLEEKLLEKMQKNHSLLTMTCGN